MDVQRMEQAGGAETHMVAGLGGALWADGLNEQEDELDDVRNGVLDAPTDDEGPGEISERNGQGQGLETEDEDDGLVKRIEDRGVPDRRGDTGPSDWDESIENLDELARRAGVKLPE